VKLFTHVSPSHRAMAEEILLPSAVEFDVTVYEGEQHGDGTWQNDGWRAATRDKATSMLRAWHDAEGDDMFVWADADVVLTGPIVAILRANMYCGQPDMLFQQDETPETVCSGFFCARRNEAVRDILTLVANEPYPDSGPCDQAIMNRHKGRVNYRMLSTTQFWTVGHISRRYQEHVRIRIRRNKFHAIIPYIPPDLRMYHANFITSTTRKIGVLRTVRNSRWTRK